MFEYILFGLFLIVSSFVFFNSKKKLLKRDYPKLYKIFREKNPSLTLPSPEDKNYLSKLMLSDSFKLDDSLKSMAAVNKDCEKFLEQSRRQYWIFALVIFIGLICFSLYIYFFTLARISNLYN